MASACETLVFRLLHDALLKGYLDNATCALGGVTCSRPWFLWVRTLRTGFRLLARRHGARAAV
jgi:hypothetical protein